MQTPSFQKFPYAPPPPPPNSQDKAKPENNILADTARAPQDLRHKPGAHQYKINYFPNSQPRPPKSPPAPGMRQPRQVPPPETSKPYPAYHDSMIPPERAQKSRSIGAQIGARKKKGKEGNARTSRTLGSFRDQEDEEEDEERKLPTLAQAAFGLGCGDSEEATRGSFKPRRTRARDGERLRERERRNLRSKGNVEYDYECMTDSVRLLAVTRTRRTTR